MDKQFTVFISPSSPLAQPPPLSLFHYHIKPWSSGSLGVFFNPDRFSRRLVIAFTSHDCYTRKECGRNMVTAVYVVVFGTVMLMLIVDGSVFGEWQFVP